MPSRPVRAAKRRAKRRLDSSQSQEDSENEGRAPALKRRKISSKSRSSQSGQSSQSSQSSQTSASSKSKPQRRRRGRKRAKRHSSDSDGSDSENRPSKKRRVDAPKQSKGIQPQDQERATDDDRASSVRTSDKDSSVSPESALADRRADIIIRWLTGGESLKDKVGTIQDWMNEDEETFSLVMIQLMLRLAGARTYRVTRAHLEGPTNTDRDVRALIKEIEDSYEDAEDDDEKDDEKEEEKQDEERPTRKKGRKGGKSDPGKPELFARGWNKLLSRYKQFITLVADKNIATVFQDDYFYDVFLNWCKILARHAQMRQLRRVGVHTAFYMMDGIVGHLASTRKDALTAQRKLSNLKDEEEDVRRKMQKVLADHNDRLQNLKSLTDIVLDQIVAYKYADTDPHIREQVLKSIPNWVNTDPSQTYLLTNHWIKYLSWGLHDSDAAVRKAGLDGLEKLFHYKQRKSRGKTKQSNTDAIDSDRLRALSALLTRYKERILEMSNDIDSECCSTAIGLMTTLLRNELLNEEEGNEVAECIFDEDATIRKSAATFIFADSFEMYQDDDEKQKPDISDKHREDLVELCKITRDRNLSLCRKYGKAGSSRSYFEPAAFIVNELYSLLDCLRDWETMIDLLLQSEESENDRDQRNMRKKKKKQGAKAVQIKESEQQLLCYILLASVKKACRELDESISFGRKSTKKRLRKKDEEEIDKWYEDFCTVCAPRIADLLKTFQSDSIKSYAIVQMIQHLPLDIFESQDLRGKLDTIVETLSRMFLIHEVPMRSQVEDVDDSKQEFNSQVAQATMVTQLYTNRVNLNLQFEIMNAFQYLSNEHHTYQEPVQDAILEIATQVMDRFDELRVDFLDNCQSHQDETDVKLNDEESETIQSMFSCVSRLQHISSALKVGRLEWNDDMGEILTAVVESHVSEYQELISPLSQILVADVMWNLSSDPSQDSFEFAEKMRVRVELMQDVLNRLLDEGIANLEEDSEDDERAFVLSQDGSEMEENVGRLVDALTFAHLRSESVPNLRDTWHDGGVHCFPEALCAKLGDFFRLMLLFFHVTNSGEAADSGLTQDASETDPAVIFTRENMEIRSLVRCCRLGSVAPYRASKLCAIALSFIRRGIGRSKVKQWRQRHRDLLDGFFKRMGKVGVDYRTNVLFDAMLEIFRHEPDETRSDSLESFCALIQQKLSGIRKKKQGTFVKLVGTCLNHVLTPEHVVEHIPLLPPLLRFVRMSVNRDVLKLWEDLKELERQLPAQREGDVWEIYDSFRKDFHEMVKKSRRLREIDVESDDEDPSQAPQEAGEERMEDAAEPQEESQVFQESQRSFNFDAPSAAVNADEEHKDMEEDDNDEENESRVANARSKMSKGVGGTDSDVEMADESEQAPSVQKQPTQTTPRRSPRKKRGKARAEPQRTPRGQWVSRRK